jgi:steroid 5-alpha reductase family enzyme
LLDLNGIKLGDISKKDEGKLRDIIKKENHKIKILSCLTISTLLLMLIAMCLFFHVSDRRGFDSSKFLLVWSIIVVLFGVIIVSISVRLSREKIIFKQIEDLLIKLDKTTNMES